MYVSLFIQLSSRAGSLSAGYLTIRDWCLRLRTVCRIDPARQSIQYTAGLVYSIRFNFYPGPSSPHTTTLYFDGDRDEYFRLYRLSPLCLAPLYRRLHFVRNVSQNAERCKCILLMLALALIKFRSDPIPTLWPGAGDKTGSDRVVNEALLSEEHANDSHYPSRHHLSNRRSRESRKEYAAAAAAADKTRKPPSGGQTIHSGGLWPCNVIHTCAYYNIVVVVPCLLTARNSRQEAALAKCRAALHIIFIATAGKLLSRHSV